MKLIEVKNSLVSCTILDYHKFFHKNKQSDNPNTYIEDNFDEIL